MPETKDKRNKRMKWIVGKAKEIQKKHPNTTWQSAIAKAGKKWCGCKGKGKND